jgi:Cytochrome bd terminal oxidase subunit I
VNFAMGVVSSLVMAYQFGTNWNYFSTFAGITGPLLTHRLLPRSSDGTRSDQDCTSSQRIWWQPAR